MIRPDLQKELEDPSFVDISASIGRQMFSFLRLPGCSPAAEMHFRISFDGTLVEVIEAGKIIALIEVGNG